MRQRAMKSKLKRSNLNGIKQKDENDMDTVREDVKSFQQDDIENAPKSDGRTCEEAAHEESELG